MSLHCILLINKLTIVIRSNDLAETFTLQEQLQHYQNQYDILLEILGERDEKVEELQQDLIDVKVSIESPFCKSTLFILLIAEGISRANH